MAKLCNQLLNIIYAINYIFYPILTTLSIHKSISNIKWNLYHLSQINWLHNIKKINNNNLVVIELNINFKLF